MVTDSLTGWFSPNNSAGSHAFIFKAQQGGWNIAAIAQIICCLLLLYSTHLNCEPLGVAIPYPLESRFPPTFIVSQGLRCSVYSFIVDSRRKAYFPLDLRTLATPSAVVLVKTVGSADFMYDHIFSYTAILDLCVLGGEEIGLKVNVNRSTVRMFHTLVIALKAILI